MQLSENTQNRAAPGAVELAFGRYVSSQDRVALESTIQAVSPELRRIARYYVGNADLTEDLVQATMLTAIERADSFDPNRRLVPWMTGILLNKIAAHRRDVRRRRIDIDREEPLERSPLALAENKEVARLVSEALEQLPPRYRQVLDMYLRQGKRGGEIADELARPPGTIRAQIHRGLRRLRTLLPPSLALGSLFALRRSARGGVRQASSGTSLGEVTFFGPSLLGLGLLAGLVVLVGVLWTGDARTLAHDEPLDPAAPGAPPTAATGMQAADLPGEGSARTTRSNGAAAPPAAAALTGPRLAFQTRDRLDDRPLGDVALEVVVAFENGQSSSLRGTTDEEGFLAFPLDVAGVTSATLVADRAGYGIFRADWDRGRTAFQSDAPLSVPLTRSRPIGGVVVDENGAPIAGATVYLAGSLLSDGQVWSSLAREPSTTTDAAGRWRIERASEAPLQLRVRAAHPDHVPLLAQEKEASPPPEDLWNLDARLVLRSGEPMEVLVRDQDGRTIPGAAVELLDLHDPPRYVTHYRADEQGRLRFTAPEPRHFLLRVSADGFAREIKRVRPRHPLVQHVTLVGAVDLEVTLIDSSGEPVSDAQLRRFGTTWEEALQTDAEGRLTVPVDPKGSLMLQAHRGTVLGSARVRVDLETGIGVLPAPSRIRLAVTDASDGTPLSDYSVTVRDTEGRRLGSRVVHDASPIEIAFESSAVGTAPGRRTAPGRVVEVSALGYRTETSAVLRPGSELLPVSLALSPTRLLRFDVVNPAGEPVDFLEVAVATPTHPITLRRGTMAASAAHPEKLQSPSGQGIRMNRPEGEFALVVCCREGFAFIPGAELDARGVVEIEPWSCLEGNTAPDGRLRLEPVGAASEGLVVEEHEAHASSAGAYHVCALPPGRYSVAEAEGGSSAASRMVTLRAGATQSLDL